VTDDVRRRMVELLPRLRRFAYVLTRDQERGDDLVQEACLRALSRLDQWDKGTRLDSWMYRIAQNIWLDSVRARTVRGEQIDIDAHHDLPGEDGRAVTDSRLTLSDLGAAMDNLPPAQKVLIALVCIEGCSYREAAHILDAPIGTIMSRLARARQALYIATHGEAPDQPAHSKETVRDRSDR
jgi:RNA polymerase sigma-70 factor (ECF subfamily)